MLGNDEGQEMEFVFIDMDRTLLTDYSLSILISDLKSRGMINGVDKIRGMAWFALYKMNIMTDVAKALEILLISFKGWHKCQMVDYIEQLVDLKLNTIIDYPLWDFIQGRSTTNTQFILITSSFDMIANAVAHRLGIRNVIASRISIEDDYVTGRINGDCITGPAREKAMQDYIANLKYSCKFITTYYADHCSDIPILEWVDRPYAVNPDRRLRQYAMERDWPIFERDI